MTFWPFWAGGVALGTVAVSYLLITRRGFGVSGLWGIFLDPQARRNQGVAPSEAALHEAMIEATRRAFPDAQVAADVAPPGERPALPQAPVSWNMAALFIAGVSLGGAVSALARGSFGSIALPARFVASFGNGPLALVALFAGGILVGAGTRLAGGCTSGHGLVGTARLQPASMVSTAIFFGLAILIALTVLR